MSRISDTEHDIRALECVKRALDEQQFGSLTERVHNALRSEIQSGNLRPHTRLRETDLASVLNVSRTPIRESIQRLETEDLIERAPNGSVIVRGIPLRELIENYEILMVLETHAVRRVVENATDQEVHELQQIVDLMAFFGEQERWEDVTAQGVLFHNRLSELSGNTQLANLIKRIRKATHAARRVSLRTRPGVDQAALDSHYPIVDAIRDRDQSRAVALMAEHLHSAIRRLEGNETDVPDYSRFID